MLKVAGLLFKIAIVLPIAVALLAAALMCLWPERAVPGLRYLRYLRPGKYRK